MSSQLSLLFVCPPAGHVYKQNETSEQVILSFDSVLPAHVNEVGLEFSYTLKPGLEGLYRSQFTGNTLDMIYTNSQCREQPMLRLLLTGLSVWSTNV